MNSTEVMPGMQAEANIPDIEEDSDMEETPEQESAETNAEIALQNENLAEKYD